jgi:hypothetical protein
MAHGLAGYRGATLDIPGIGQRTIILVVMLCAFGHAIEGQFHRGAVNVKKSRVVMVVIALTHSEESHFQHGLANR